MVGSEHTTLIGPPPPASTELIGALPEGGADAIASRGEVPEGEELLDNAAMEAGTD
ncbi:hypothetical protein GCM10029964_038080 [Kibdelosporangium lantanae]